MYLLGRGGWYPQDLLRQLVLGGDLKLGTIKASGLAPIHALMAQYSDTSMDFADASLVVFAEQISVTRFFTLGSHFQAYRVHDRQRLEIIP
jgi:predicted nucleic acid-binding protein